MTREFVPLGDIGDACRLVRRRWTAPGGARGARTPDLLHAMQALFQLSYGPASWYRANAGRREQPTRHGLQSGMSSIAASSLGIGQ